METSKISLYISHLNATKNVEIPKYCPNCGIGNNPVTKEISNLGTREGSVFGLFHRCVACEQSHMTIQESIPEKDDTSMTLLYPNRIVANIDPLFIKHTPRFVEFYSESVEAEKLGLENIAGAGYRSAIECLIKDYALHFELDEPEKIAALNFNNAIDRYVKDDELLNSGLHFIRKIGNDYTHWDKTTSISLPVLKSYVEIILQIFKSKLMLKHLPK